METNLMNEFLNSDKLADKYLLIMEEPNLVIQKKQLQELLIQIKENTRKLKLDRDLIFNVFHYKIQGNC